MASLTSAASPMFVATISEAIRVATSSPASADGITRFRLPDGLTINLYGREAALANPSAPQESASAPPTSVICGQSSTASSRSAVLQSSLENRLRQRLDVNGSPEYSLTWKEWTISGQQPICALRASARPTSGKDRPEMAGVFLTESASGDTERLAGA